jgi:homoserine O-acetyltransferase/O-succinyltransferase
MRPTIAGTCMLVVLLARPLAPAAQEPGHPTHQLFELGDLALESGTTLPSARLLYVTHGTLNPARDNAILTPSYAGGNHHGYDFLLKPGGGLDTTRYFVIATEMFGSGGSSSPSNTPPPFDGPRFPQVTIRDNVAASYRLLTERLGIRHLRAVAGFSMGAQQALQWAVSQPDFMDRIVAWCGTAKTYPHGWVFLEGGIRAWQTDPAFADGNYRTRPMKGQAAAAAHWAAWVFSQEWWRRELYKPKWASPEALLDEWSTDTTAQDPNDEILQSRAWQRNNVGDTPGFDGDLARALGSIKAAVLYLPCATDLYFPKGDIVVESRFIPRVTVVTIPSLWGHAAGAGWNPADAAFLNREIGRFLTKGALPRSNRP